MVQTLIAGGDSFTYGNDLKDCLGHPSQLSWSAILAKNLNCNYVCLAKPGGGNQTIARRVINYLEKIDSTECFVAIMWTFPARIEVALNRQIHTKYSSLFDLTDENFITISNHHTENIDEFIAKLPAQIKSEQIVFFKAQQNKIIDSGIHNLASSLYNIANESYFLFETIKSILLVQFYLEKNNIPYVFSAAQNLVDEIKSSNNNFIQTWSKLINFDKWVSPEIGFYDWAKEKNYKLLSMYHPEEQAHYDWYYHKVIKKVKGFYGY